MASSIYKRNETIEPILNGLTNIGIKVEDPRIKDEERKVKGEKPHYHPVLFWLNYNQVDDRIERDWLQTGFIARIHEPEIAAILAQPMIDIINKVTAAGLAL